MAMPYQPALASSAFRGLHDELLAYFTLFCDTRELLSLAQVNSVFHVFAREEPLWMMHCLRLHGGDFSFNQSWRLTTFFPRADCKPPAMPVAFPPLVMRSFGSDFLYRRWCRRHMSLKGFEPSEEDPYWRRVKRIQVSELTYQEYYEQYARIPFILTGAITSWKASRTWTMAQLSDRFPHPVVKPATGETASAPGDRSPGPPPLNRITHNLDIDSSRSTTMSFRDYHRYVVHQHDETPLYVFDPRFGEKMPSLLSDYDVASLQLFREDLLLTARNASATANAAEAPSSPSSPSGVTTTPAASVMPDVAMTGAGGDGEEYPEAVPRHKSLNPDFRWIVMGPERTGAPWHTDPSRTSAWNALLRGRKRWALYPPGSPPPGVSPTQSSRASKDGSSADGSSDALSMTSLAWYLHVYPTLAPHKRPIEVIQRPGDVIYVPSGWWHLVLNISGDDEDNTEEMPADDTAGVSIAVTHNFVDSHNLPAFVKDLLRDEQFEALRVFQDGLRNVRPESYDVCRLLQIPRMHGYLDEELYTSAFRVAHHWKQHLRTVLRRLARRQQQGDSQTLLQTGRQRLRVLTARVNPTFAVHESVVVKFYSERNQDWGEFHMSAFLAPRFEEAGQEEEGDTSQGAKKRSKKTNEVRGSKYDAKEEGELHAHELKSRMTLRYAMEECYRIETTAYRLIAAAVARDQEDVATSQGNHAKSVGPRVRDLATMVPALFDAGHLLDVSEVDDINGDGLLWRWPYAVLEYRPDLVGIHTLRKRSHRSPGCDGADLGGITPASWRRLANWLSKELLPRLHAVHIDPALRGVYGHRKATWRWYAHYLLLRRKSAISMHMQEAVTPPQLVNALEYFLPAPTASAIAEHVLPPWSRNAPSGDASYAPPVLLHGDLTDENVLGKLHSSPESHEESLTALLSRIGLSEYEPLLMAQEKLTMATLRLATESQLVVLGLPLGPRLALLEAVQSATASQACASESLLGAEETLSDGSDSDSEDDNELEVEEESMQRNLLALTDDALVDLQRRRLRKFANGVLEWTPTLVLDFADAKTGDPLYDLVAVFFAALHCDRELWKTTLATPYWQNYMRREQVLRSVDATTTGRLLRERFLKLALLHPSRSADSLFHHFPAAYRLMTWPEVAQHVFGDLFVPSAS